MDKKELDFLSQRILKSKNKLNAAKHSLENKDFEDAISRAYYAVFHSANALLQYVGVEVKSHQALKQMFGLHLVQSGLVEKEMGRCLNDLKDERENGDYDVITYFDKNDAEKAIEKAKIFIEKTVEFFKKNGITISSMDSNIP